jgi:hypothetical protein
VAKTAVKAMKRGRTLRARGWMVMAGSFMDSDFDISIRSNLVLHPSLGSCFERYPFCFPLSWYRIRQFATLLTGWQAARAAVESKKAGRPFETLVR